MITKTAREIDLECDDCGATLNGGFSKDEFRDMIDYAKSEGWSVKPDGDGGWEHLCDECH